MSTKRTRIPVPTGKLIIDEHGDTLEVLDYPERTEEEQRELAEDVTTIATHLAGAGERKPLHVMDGERVVLWRACDRCGGTLHAGACPFDGE